MNPKRPRTPEELGLETEIDNQPSEQRSLEKGPAPPTEAASNPVEAENAVTENPVADVDPTSGALDPRDLFGSLDVGLPEASGDVPDSIAAGRSLEVGADLVPASAAPIAPDAFSAPSIEEIVASFRAPPISDVPAAILARDMVSTWQDLPSSFDSHHDNATADVRETTQDDVSAGDPQSAPPPMDVGGFTANEPVEPPSGAHEDLDTFDRTPSANPADYIAIGNFAGPANDLTAIQRGPVRTDDDSWRHSITLLSASNGDSGESARQSSDDLSPRATTLQSPTSDGGPPLARPIFLVSVPDEQTRRILDEALAEAGRRDAKSIAEIAQQKVDDAFWLRACEERALYGGR